VNFLDQIALASLGVAVLSVVVTVVLTAVVARSGSRSQEKAQQILEALQGLVTANRLDRLAGQAAELSNHDDLLAVVAEARSVGEGRAVRRVEESYWANSAVRAGSVDANLAESVRITQENLADKLDRCGGDRVFELGKFVSVAKDSSEFMPEVVALWLLSQSSAPTPFRESEIQYVLERGPDELLGVLLRELGSFRMGWSDEVKAGAIGAAAAVYLGRIGYDFNNPDGHTGATHERATRNAALAGSVLTGLALALKSGHLKGLARSADPARTRVGALLVAMAGAASYSDKHGAMRVLQSIGGVGVEPSRLGGYGSEYRFGISKFAEYQPGLLTEFWPEGAAYLAEVAS